MLALRRLTRKADPSVFVRMMDRASDFSNWLDPEDWDSMHSQLINANAYQEPDQDGSILKWTKE